MTSQGSPIAGRIVDWLIQRGIEGMFREPLLRGYCEELGAHGVPLYRMHVAQSGFHPKYGAMGFEWVRGRDVATERFEFTEEPLQQWLESPLYQLFLSGDDMYRERIVEGGGPSRFPLLDALRQEGASDYLAFGLVLEPQETGAARNPDNPPEGVLLSYTSDGAAGFSDDDIDLIRATLPALGLALKSASNRRMATDLLRVYLGEDAGRRVLSGEIRRGSLREIRAVIFHFDLTDFTQMSERIPGADMIAMLNDYFSIVVDEIQSRGGHVLKFIGDGLLAMFDHPDQGVAARDALDVAIQVRRRLASRNRDRREAALPATGFTLALHAGDILYGNIGAETRLDFTVIGPAVNLTARLSEMYRALGQSVILSGAVASHADGARHDVVSLGRYMLRGIAEPQELFTLYDGA